jgi:hypothetical protein
VPVAFEDAVVERAERIVQLLKDSLNICTSKLNFSHGIWSKVYIDITPYSIMDILSWIWPP